MSSHDSPGLTQFELGELVHPKQRALPSDRATAWEWMLYEWPDWCSRMKKVLPAERGTFYVPPLLRWWKDEDRQVEYFDIGLPGAFDAQQPRTEIPDFLKSSKGAEAQVTLMAPPEQVAPLLRERGLGDMPVMRVVLSYFRLPELEIFDLTRVPSSADQFYLGRLSEGSDLIWDTSVENPHALLVGKTRSGKSETAAAIAAQAWKKGWRIVIISPTVDDPTFLKFAELCPEDVVLGSTDEDYKRAAAVWQSLDEEMHRREGEKAQHRCNTWGMERDGVQWIGRPTLIITDECGDFFEPDGAVDSEVALECKKQIRALHAKHAAKGAKVRHHLIDMTQNPNVDAVGGGKALRNMGLVVAVRALASTWFPVVFENSTSTAIPAVLSNPATKRGRAVARGAKPPDNEFGGVVDDTPVQLAYFEQEAREAWLDEGRNDDVPPVLTVVEADGEHDPGDVWVDPPSLDARPNVELVPDRVDAELHSLDPAMTPPELIEPSHPVVPGEPATHGPPPVEQVLADPIAAPAEWTNGGREPLTVAQRRILKACIPLFVAFLVAAPWLGGALGWACAVCGLIGASADVFALSYYADRTPKPVTARREVTPGLIIAPCLAGVVLVFAVVVVTTLA
jgi:hypothetical protein